MQVHRELYIHGTAEQLTAFGEQIKRVLSDGWHIDGEAEAHLRRVGVDRATQVYCLSSPPRGRRPTSTIFLLSRDATTLYIANITPGSAEPNKLTRAQYNAIVHEFYTQYAEPVGKGVGVRVEMTAPEVNLEYWLSTEAADKLNRFCQLAGKWSGSSHPSDQKRWYDFLIAAHEEASTLTASELLEWLKEDGGWDARTASQLACEYEFARGLLASAGQSQVGVS